MNEKSSKSRPSNGAKTKPVIRHHAASSSNLNSHTSTSGSEMPKKIKPETKKVGKIADEVKMLFGGNLW